MEFFKAKYIFISEDLLFALRNFLQFCTSILSVSVTVLNDSTPPISPLAQCLGRWARVINKTNWERWPLFHQEIVGAIWKVTEVCFIAIIYKKPLSVCVLRIRLIILGSYHWETVTFLPADILFFPRLTILLGASA